MNVLDMIMVRVSNKNIEAGIMMLGSSVFLRIEHARERGVYLPEPDPLPLNSALTIEPGSTQEYYVVF